MKHVSSLLVAMTLSLSLACGDDGTRPAEADAAPGPTDDRPDAGQPEPEPQPDAGGSATEPDAAAQAAVPRLEAVPCRYPLAADQVEGETVHCADLIVLEDRSRPEGATLRLHIARYASALTASDPATPPVIFLSGGPGGTSAGLTQALSRPLASFFTAAGDLIAFDQRGVGVSEPALRCPELDPLAGSDLRDMDGYMQAYTAAMRACQDRLTASGIDLAAYTTVANAADVEDMRIALGADTIKLLGGSYGTRLGLEIMRQYPDTIQAVVLDALAPPQVMWTAEAGKNGEDAIARLFAECEADAACGAAYGDLDQALANAVATLNQTPLELPRLGMTINGNDLIVTLFNFMYIHLSYPLIPGLVTAASNRNVAEIERLVQPLLPLLNSGGLDWGMHYSMVCSDHGRYLTNEDLDAAYAGVRPELAAVFRHIFGTAYIDLCATWPVPPEDADGARSMMEPVVADIPTLVMSGEFDPITPTRYGHLTAETLSAATVVDFPNTGHGSSSSSLCGLNMAFAFLRDPQAPIDTSCTSDITLQFEVPQSIRQAFAPIRPPLPFSLSLPSIAPRPLRN